MSTKLSKSTYHNFRPGGTLIHRDPITEKNKRKQAIDEGVGRSPKNLLKESEFYHKHGTHPIIETEKIFVLRYICL